MTGDSLDWDEVARRDGVAPRLWRDFSDSIYEDLFQRWLGAAPYRRALKTDLFDEAFGCGLITRLEQLADEVHGMDISRVIVESVQARHPNIRASVEDIRGLSYPSDLFDLVVSNSTLDHFQRAQDLEDSLAELFRVVRPGGTCVVSLDNLSNPIVRLRGILPFAPLHRLGILPYYVGHTLSPYGLKEALCQAGFEVKKQTTVMHVPRLPAVWLCKLIERFGLHALQSSVLAFFHSFERLERWPLRDLSGYFTVCLAEKPSGT
jgi:SAM-dependent methyltransferase